MARTTLQIQFNGTPDHPLDLMIGYPRQIIRHIFRAQGELYDVTDICSADELNRNSQWAALKATGAFSLVVTPGTDDVGDQTPSKLAPQSGNFGIPCTLRIPMTAGAGGSPDDITFVCPFKLRVIGTRGVIQTTVSSSNITLRTAAAGAGSIASGTVSGATAGPVVEGGTAFTSTQVFASGAIIYARRSDNGIAGELLVSVVREP